VATVRSAERKQAKARGKQTEYACAKAMHGTVVGRSKAVKVGDTYVSVNCQRPPDVVAPGGFSFECKNTKFPKGVAAAAAQAERNAPAAHDGIVWWFDADTGTTYIVMTKAVFLDRMGYQPEARDG